MDYLLYGPFCLWFECLYKQTMTKGLRYEEEEDSQDSYSDSYCDGVTQYFGDLSQKKSVASGKGYAITKPIIYYPTLYE